MTGYYAGVGRMVGLRLLQGIPLVLLVVTVNFLIIQMAPGDPVDVMLAAGSVSADQVDAVRQQLGLDQPLIVQYLLYIKGLAVGDLGTSYAFNQPVTEVLGARLPASILLMLVSLGLAAVVGMTLGTIAARNRGKLVDRVLMIGAVIGFSVPTFWLAFLGLMVFAVGLGWLPVSGMRGDSSLTGFAAVLDVARHMVLPVTVLTIFNSGLISRLMRTSMIKTLDSDFIVTARAAGIAPRRVLLRYAFPNAVTPIITVIGLQIGLMLSGAVVTETVFGWPGIGPLTVTAVSQRDYPVLLAIFLITSLLVIAANIATDIVYALINPRLRTNA